MKIDAKLPDPPKPRTMKIGPTKRGEGDLTLGLGRHIKAIRERRGLRQQDVADAAGVDRSSLCNIETGNQKVSIVQLAAIAKALEMEFTITLTPIEGNRS